MRTVPNLALITTVALLCGACSQTGTTTLPRLTLPESWNSWFRASPSSSALLVQETTVESAWWEAFNDPLLNTLIQKATTQNFDLKTATARIREARADRGVARTRLLPELSGTASAGRANQGVTTFDKPVNLFEAGFDASWEIDLFGGNQKRLAAADARIEAQIAERDSVALSIAAEVARNYMEVRNFQNQIRIAHANIRSQEETLKLTESRKNAGLASELESSQARSQLFATQSQLPVFQAGLDASKNRLSVLVGEHPGTLDPQLEAPAPVPVATRAVALATPSDILARRPDVARAEKQLLAATLLKQAAVTDLYPKVSLSSLFGIQNSTRFDTTGTWSVGAGLVTPLFNFGRIQSQIDASDARAEQAMLSYQQTVLLALEEVETSLSAYLNEDERLTKLDSAVKSNEETVALATERYKKGISAFVDVLIAQRSLYEAQSQQAQSQADVSKKLVALYKSLGAVAK